ncbi:MAG TPA: hypothetical protein VGE29_03145, partial [Prosthecobacter sp.]
DAPLTVEDAMKLIFSGGLIVPSSLTAPASKPDISPAPLPVADETHVPEETKPEPELPVGLPRAEDFDSGDPDILSDSEVEAAELAGSHSAGKRILSALSWRRK